MDADHGGSPEERLAIETAQAGLDVLRKGAVLSGPARNRDRPKRV